MYAGPDLQVVAMSSATGARPALEWSRGLGCEQQVQFEAVCTAVEKRLVAGKSLLSLARMLPASRAGLWQLLLTMPGYPGTHPSLIYLPMGMLFWAVAGVSTARGVASRVGVWDLFAADWIRRNIDGAKG
jgi:hypothetical protein